MLTLWLDRLMLWSLCLLIFLLPATTAGVEICSAAAILFFLVKKGIVLSQGLQPFPRCLNAPVPVPSVYYPVAFFTAVCLLSVFMSHYTLLSLKAFVGKTLEYVLLFFVIQETLITSRRRQQFLMFFLVSAGIVCLDAFWQFTMGHDIFRGVTAEHGRISSTFNHPNSLGAYLVVALPLIYFWIHKTFRREGFGFKVFLAGGLFVLALIVMGVTYSRGAWAGLLAAFLILFFLDCRARWFFGVCIVGALVIFPVLFIEGRNFAGAPGTFTSALSMAHTSQGTAGTLLNSSGRWQYWSDAVRIFRDHPVFGTGLNTYTEMIRQYSPGHSMYPHNCYLQLAAELGILGLVSFLWLIGSVLRMALVQVFRSDEPGVGLTRVLLAAFTGLALQCFFDTTFYSSQLAPLFWIIMGLCVVSAMTQQDPQRSSGRTA